MKTMIMLRAATMVLTLGIGSAYATDGDDQSATTLFTSVDAQQQQQSIAAGALQTPAVHPRQGRRSVWAPMAPSYNAGANGDLAARDIWGGRDDSRGRRSGPATLRDRRRPCLQASPKARLALCLRQQGSIRALRVALPRREQLHMQQHRLRATVPSTNTLGERLCTNDQHAMAPRPEINVPAGWAFLQNLAGSSYRSNHGSIFFCDEQTTRKLRSNWHGVGCRV